MLSKILALGLLVGTVQAADYQHYVPLPFHSEFGGPFALTAHTGEAVTDADLHGRYALLYFGYTSCATVCPTTLSSMADALQRLGPRRAEVVPVFINLDARRDSLDELTAYVDRFLPGFIALTGTTAQVRVAAAAYGIRFRAVEGTTAQRRIVHSGKIFLLGPDGRVVDYFPHEAPPEWLLSGIVRQLEDQS